MAIIGLLFYIAINAVDKPLYIRTIDPHQQATREEWIKSVETSFLREDVTRIEVWSVRGGAGQMYLTETFTDTHQDLHFATCAFNCLCGKRVFTSSRYARCPKCKRLKCHEHGAFDRKSNQSLCLDCYGKE
jgi:hypothetical protein